MEEYRSTIPVSQGPRKRSRIVWSCSNCRRSKQRCDREIPCRTCLLRNKQGSCKYDDKSVRDVSHTQHSTVRSDNLSALSKEGKLITIGYSELSSYNSVGILTQLEQYKLQDRLPSPSKESGMFVSESAYNKYEALVRQLPCDLCVRTIAGVFFYDFNWQYTLLDHNYFNYQSCRFYTATPESKDLDITAFPSVIFQVLALGLQFMPEPYTCQSGKECRNSQSTYSHVSAEIQPLFKTRTMNLSFVLARFLRVSWLKNQGLVIEAWNTLGQAIKDAEEMGLHHDWNMSDVTDAESECGKLWAVQMRRRTVVSLFLWDSQMAMVLGKPMNLNYSDNIILPVDCDVPENLESKPPSPRQDFEGPSPFTFRLLEIYLANAMRDLRSLECNSHLAGDYTTITKIHERTLNYIESLPPLYRFEDPDTSFDLQCHWLPPQRQYFRSSIMFFLVLLHRSHLFHIPQSRKDLLLCGTDMLEAQQRFFEALKPNQHTMFALTYLSVEPCVSILSVLISHPNENLGLKEAAFDATRLAVARLQKIQHATPLAKPGFEVIQVLLARAELATYPSAIQNYPPSLLNSSSILPRWNSATNFWDDEDLENQVPNQHGRQFGQDTPGLLRWVPGSSSFPIPPQPLLPMADLVYCDLATVPTNSLNDGMFGNEVFDDRVSQKETQYLQQSLIGTFDEQSFWRVLNSL